MPSPHGADGADGADGPSACSLRMPIALTGPLLDPPIPTPRAKVPRAVSSAIAIAALVLLLLLFPYFSRIWAQEECSGAVTMFQVCPWSGEPSLPRTAQFTAFADHSLKITQDHSAFADHSLNSPSAPHLLLPTWLHLLLSALSCLCTCMCRRVPALGARHSAYHCAVYLSSPPRHLCSRAVTPCGGLNTLDWPRASCACSLRSLLPALAAPCARCSLRSLLALALSLL